MLTKLLNLFSVCLANSVCALLNNVAGLLLAFLLTCYFFQRCNLHSSHTAVIKVLTKAKEFKKIKLGGIQIIYLVQSIAYKCRKTPTYGWVQPV